MRKNLVQFILVVMVVIGIITGFNTKSIAHSNGSPAGYTGSPGDGHNCTSCHGGTAATVSGWITTNVPSGGYTGGNTYTITVTVTGSGAKGFEVSPQNATGTQLGTLAAGSGSKLVGGTKYCTHSSASNSNPTTWNFSWTAPVAGTGTVTMYGAFVVSQPNVKIGSLAIPEAAAPLTANATATPSTIDQGQSSQLDVVATGGSGTYTYSWTSNPAGFTSNIRNPVASPTVTTTYTVTVNDGSTNATGNCTVTVIPAAPLTATATADPNSVCEGASSQLDVIVTGGSGTYTYSWTSNPAGFTSNLKNPMVTPSGSTLYMVDVNDGTSNANGSVNVSVTEPATAAAGADTIACNTATQIQVSGSAANYATVQWTTSGTGTFANASALSTLYYPSASDIASGSLDLTLTATPLAPCSGSAVSVKNLQFEVCNGIPGAENNTFNIVISPNPSEGIVKLSFSGSNSGTAQVVIYDIGGRIISTEVFGSADREKKLDLSAYPKGIYFVKAQNDNQTKTLKLILR
jgi:hypothetical protein